MNISKPFIHRPVFTVLIMTTIIFFGVLCYFKLPVSSLPQIQYPTITVNTSYPGATAEQISRLVTMPLERQFMQMQGIKIVTSDNTYESSAITLTFQMNKDINTAAEEVQEAIQKASGELPNNLPSLPNYSKVNPSDTPIFFLVVHSPVINPATIYEYAYSFLGLQVSTAEGIAKIQMYGSPYAARVEIDPQEIAAKSITLQEIANAINSANTQQPTGKFYSATSSIPTNLDGELQKAEEYNNIIVKMVDGQPVRIGDIGVCKDSLQNNKQTFTWTSKEDPSGQGAAVLALFREIGYNTVKASNNVYALLEKLKNQIPDGLTLTVPFTLSKWILQAIDDVKMTLYIAFLLVIVVVYIYLGKLRNTAIPIITLPIIFCGTFALMYIFGYSLNILTLSALTLSIGFLVDDAIVVIENIVRWAQESSASPYQAALYGAKQIMMTVVSISLCLTAVFIPMLYLEGAVGELFHEFAAVVIIAVLISAFVSLSLTPMLSSRFIPPYNHTHQTRMECFSMRLNEKLLSIYERMLAFLLTHKFSVLIASLCSVIASGFIYLSMPKEFLPQYDLGIIECFAQSKSGTSPEKMKSYIMKVAERGVKNDFVSAMASISGTPTDNQAIFFYNLVDRDKRKSIWECMAELQKQMDEEVGVQIVQKPYPLINLQVGSLTAGKASYQYILQSFNTESLFSSSQTLIDALKKEPLLSNVTTNFEPYSPMLKVHIQRDRAHSYSNLDATTIERAFTQAYGETYISKMNTTQNMYYVILELKDHYLEGPEDIPNLYLGNMNYMINMNSVIESKMTSSPSVITRLNGLPSVILQFDTAKGVPISKALEKVEEIASNLLPPDVIKSISGNAEEFEKSIIRMMMLFVLAVFVVYIILGILYENFIFPVAPLSAIPVALLGGLLSLLIFNQPLSIFANIGLIMLLGIVMKNGILIVDFALEKMEKECLPAHEAVYYAALTRFRPILMTTLAAMMGAVPIALGIGGAAAAGRAPLGIAVLGGLVFSQAVTLFVVPVAFIYIEKINSFFKTRFQLFQDFDETEEDE